MKYDLQGTTMQMLNVELENGESVVSESGRLVYMTDNVEMQTQARGGVWAGVKRAFAGESFFLTNFIGRGGKAVVGFGSEFPGKIIPMKLKKGEGIIAQKDAFICSEESVTFDATWTRKIGAGILGGEGLILLKIRGPGLVFFNVGGEVSQIDLKKGEKIRVDTGNLAMFDESVAYDVERVRGVKNIIFGGEGLFLATCTGPGRVWVQSMPVNELAAKLMEYMPNSGGKGMAAGALLGTIMAARK
ncbi:MAG: TIGR00266 family protein [Candidatus Aenigmatarchaeota archaeon]